MNSPLPCRRLAIIILSACGFALTSNAAIAPAGATLDLTNVDKRMIGAPAAPFWEPARAAGLQRVREKIPDVKVDLDEIVASPKWVRSQSGFIGRAQNPVAALRPLQLAANRRAGNFRAPVAAGAADRHAPVKSFLDEHSGLFGHGAEILTGARISREFVTAHNGLRTVVWEQQLDGIPVFQTLLAAHITQNGELVSLSSLFLPDMEFAAQVKGPERAGLLAAPPISAQQAVANAAGSLGWTTLPQAVVALDAAPAGPERRQRFSAPTLSEAKSSLVWLPMNRFALRLCWKVELTSRTGLEMFHVLIDAQSGDDLVRHSMTAHANETTYHVFTSDSPSPFSPGHSQPSTGQPAFANRDTKTWSAMDPNASPLGWINVGDFETVGNNVDSRRNWQANHLLGYRESGTFPGVYRPTSFPDRIFNPPFDPNGHPDVQGENADVAVVQLFYWCNWMHDRLYQIGFTEAAGNFQFENVFDGVDRGGFGGDPVLADAQYGYGIALNGAPGSEVFYNFAFMFAPPSDGVSPRMRIGIYNGPDPDRDPDLDAEIILHEYTHGLSNRRVGNGIGISEHQSRGLGEGWSDFMALALLSELEDDLGGNWAMFGYTTKQWAGLQENYYYGGRRYPYSTNLTKNPMTLKDMDPAQADPHTGIPRSPVNLGPADELHNQGQVWCSALWDMRRNLIVSRGFEDGNGIALRLVVDGMNLSPPNPTFIQARDAILLADQVMNQGVNKPDIWAAFAKRGIGYSAATPGSSTTYGVVESYDPPPPTPSLWTYNASQPIYSSPAVGPDGTVYFGSADGKLHALNRNGTKKWDVSLGFSVWSYNDSSPAVGPDGDIYIATLGSDPAPIGRLYAVRRDGSIKWSYTVGDWIESSPAIGVDGTIYFGSWDGNLYALNPDGTLKWMRSLGDAVNLSSPAIDKDGVIYIGAIDNKLYAITNGTLKWTITATDWINSSPIIDWSGPGNANPANGTIYFGSYAGVFHAVNTLDGSIRWQFQTGGPIIASPAVDLQGNVYVASEDGKLYSLEPNGDFRWSYQAGAPIDSSPAIGWDGRVCFGANDGKLYVVRPDGTLLTSFQMGADSFSSPALGADGRIYIGCSDSKLYAYPAQTLLMPSSWPMFRNDPRRLGNQGSIWFDGGSMWADGSFNVTVHASRYPTPWGSLQQSNAHLRLERSHNLKDWKFLQNILFSTQGLGVINDDVAIGHESYFYRAKIPNQPLLQSRNPYGFVKLTIPPGSSMIANPLNTRSNTLAGLIPSPPPGTTFYKFSSQGWSVYTFDDFDFVWTGDTSLMPGEGGIILNPTAEPFVVTIIGEVLQGHLSAPLPSGLSIRGSMVPQPGGLSGLLGFGPEDGLATGDKVQRFINLRGDYVTYTFDTASGWSRTDPAPIVPLEPRPEAGEGMFFNLLAPRTWTRNFYVWP